MGLCRATAGVSECLKVVHFGVFGVSKSGPFLGFAKNRVFPGFDSFDISP